MISINFVCHGNICRSPMAEFVMKDLIQKNRLTSQIKVSSSATSTEEIGNPVHYGTQNILHKHGISTEGKYAIQLKKSDYDIYDYFIGMDTYNIKNMNTLFHMDPKHKVYKLLSFANIDKDIADPWYTGNFEETYEDVLLGCTSLLTYLKKAYNLT